MTGKRIPNSPALSEQESFLPIANVSRIMKKSLPANAKISKEAKETVQECVSEFISFVTGEASDKCQKEKRKTINGDDLLWAMTTLGFENYVEILKAYLSKYRETEGDKNIMARLDDHHQPASPNSSPSCINDNHGNIGGDHNGEKSRNDYLQSGFNGGHVYHHGRSHRNELEFGINGNSSWS